MRSGLLTVCSRVMFLLNLVCVNTASIAVLGNVSNQKRKTRFSKACRPQKPSTPALETWTTTSLTGYTPLHAVQANTRSNHSRIYRRPAQVGRPHSHTVGHGESSQTVWNDHALPTDRLARPSLYRSLCGQGNPSFQTMCRVLDAMGYTVTVKRKETEHE